MNVFRFFERTHRVLGINARNLDYVVRYNPLEAVSRAGDKLRTKIYLEKHNVPVPQTLLIIQRWKDIDAISWDELPLSFVVKPAGSMQGKGVLVIFGKSKRHIDSWIKFDGTLISKEEIKAHLFAILEGAFSGKKDTAFFEERVKVHALLKPYVRRGTPDIRVIVFNRVPVMAEVRLPTLRSEGRSNLHMGGIGIGVDLALGITTHGYYVGKTISLLPGTRTLLSGVAIPSWDKVLLTAVRASEAVGLGFTGVDIGIDPEGKPLVFEVNSRPGLVIQNANFVGLREHLERVKGLTIKDARQGVAVAQALFGGDITRQIEATSGKKVLGIFEPITIETSREPITVTAKLDTGAYSTSIDRALLKKIGMVKNAIHRKKIRSALGEEVRTFVEITFSLRGEKIATEASVAGRSESCYDILIGRRDLKGFLIDPAVKKRKTI